MFLVLRPATFQERRKPGPIGSTSFTDFGWIGRLKVIWPLGSVFHYIISISPYSLDRFRVIYITCQGKLIRTEDFYRRIKYIESLDRHEAISIKEALKHLKGFSGTKNIDLVAYEKILGLQLFPGQEDIQGNPDIHYGPDKVFLNG